MVLFSSFNHFNIFFLFAYLGLASGLMYFFVFWLANKAKQRNILFVKAQRKKNKKAKNLSTKEDSIVENKKEKKPAAVKSSTIFQKPNKKNSTEQRQIKKQQKKQSLQQKKLLAKHAAAKAWAKIVLLFKLAQNFLLTLLCVLVLAGVVLGSYYANFVLNNGYIRIVFVAVWVACFFFGGFVQKKVAKLLANFYNKVCKQRFNSRQKNQLPAEKKP